VIAGERLDAARSRLVTTATQGGLGDLLRATLDELEALTGSRIGFYHFVETDQSTLNLQAWSTQTEAVYCKAVGRGRHYPIREAGVWADAVRTGRPAVHNDYASLENRQGMPDGHAELVRELVVPVSRGDRFVAVLGVGNKPTDYDAEDVAVVQSFADLAWDLIERKQAREELLLKEASLSAALNAIALVDAQGLLRYVNPAFVRLWRLASEREALGRPAGEFWDARASAPRVLAAMKGGDGVRGEVEGRRADGTRFPAEYAAARVDAPDGRPVRVTVSFVDVSERAANLARLEAAAAALRALVGTSLDGYWRTDLEGRILEANATYARMSGFTVEELARMSIPDLEARETPDQTADRIRNLAASGYTRFESVHRTRTGETYPVEVSASLAPDAKHLYAFVRDLRPQRAAEEARRRLEADLARAQRLQGLGSLAGGVAHDMNNVLGAVLGLASANAAALEEGSPLRRDLETIVSACQRGRGLVRGLLDFARQSVPEPGPVDLDALVREVAALLERTTLRRIALDVRLARPAVRVHGDAGALSQP
jgi:PAS domain S-box-containing protein